MYDERMRPGRYLSVVEAGQDFEELLAHEREFRVHSVFARALNLSDGKTFLTILPLAHGCGMSYATLALARGDSFSQWGVVPGMNAEKLAGNRVQLDAKVVFDFGHAAAWQSPLREMRALRAVGEENLQLLRRMLAEHRVASPFQGVLEGKRPELGAVLDRMRSCLLAQDGSGLESAIAAVLGLGPGLTPSGDDLILGLSIARAVVRKAQRRPRGLWDTSVRKWLFSTHGLSAFFIERALEGCSHEFVEGALACLLASRGSQVRAAVERLLGIGATSGFDMGLGLYLALEWQRRYDWCSSA